ncbi:hypothetical protein BOTBODRAFT_41072 [Botryobasidium botryosum FD-172 SS1]|uniref:Ig-like domain-containing protein n=1 Tax=Botryobasidium botryosum (strain FD-172 SS1) TaxID=930990 RepID=A0A067MVR6_BOTB1|nr:hypothetical protein BOTBODRAFT_41072 [Botryobasidium botryosum FD-172 SS1]
MVRLTSAITLIALSLSSSMVTAMPAAAPAPPATPTSTGDVTINAVGGFAQSCSWWGGTYGQVGSTWVASLQATCRTASGGSVTSTIDLSRCIANDNGNLSCRANGGFTGSCSVDSSLGTGNTWLYATCRTSGGGYQRASFDVNSCVGNLNGNLAC